MNDARGAVSRSLRRIVERPASTVRAGTGSVRRALVTSWRRGRVAAQSRRGRRVLDRALGITGEALVTVGVLVGLFVVWELWWTDLQANRAQDAIVDDLGWENAAPVIPVDVTEGSPDAPTAGPVYPVIAPELVRRTDAPPSFNQPKHATTFATMYVPRWGYGYVRPISQGTDKKGVLDPLGIGHYNGTAMPGGWGNFAMAGHRTTYGKPFSRIEELRIGDPIVIRTEGAWFVYRVTQTEIVAPTAVEVLAPVPDHPGRPANGRYLTMTTCHPKYSARQRYIVHAELDYWAPSSAGYPPELIPPSVETSTSWTPDAPAPSLGPLSTADWVV